MATINVDPGGLRKAGGELNDTRETLIDQSNAHLLHGIGDDQHISTAGFWPGVWAQRELTERYNDAQQAFMNINNNVIALSSALHLVADVFDSAEQANALEFAFMNPDADTPSGLPSYVDPKVNSATMREQAEEQAALAGNLPAGHSRRVYGTSPYTKKVEILDEHGNVVSTQYVSTYLGRTSVATYDGEQRLVGYQTTEQTGNRTVTTSYDPNNTVIGTRVREQNAGGGYVVRSYTGAEKPANLTREQYKVRMPDGSTHYYTNNHSGDRTRTVDDVMIGPESPGAEPGEDLRREVDEQKQQAANQAFLAQYPHMRDEYWGFHNEHKDRTPPRPAN